MPSGPNRHNIAAQVLVQAYPEYIFSSALTSLQAVLTDISRQGIASIDAYTFSVVYLASCGHPGHPGHIEKYYVGGVRTHGVGCSKCRYPPNIGKLSSDVFDSLSLPRHKCRDQSENQGYRGAALIIVNVNGVLTS